MLTIPEAQRTDALKRRARNIASWLHDHSYNATIRDARGRTAAVLAQANKVDWIRIGP